MINFFLYMLNEILNKPYYKGREFKMNYTRKSFEMFPFRALCWLVTFLIFIMCYLTSLTLLYFIVVSCLPMSFSIVLHIVVNLDINVSANVLSNATNYCFIKVRNSLVYVEVEIKALIFLIILLFIIIKFIWLKCSHFS